MGMPHVDIFDQFKAARALEGDIHNREIGLRRIDKPHGLWRIARFATDLEILLWVDELSNSLAHHRVIVHKEHALFASDWLRFGCHRLDAVMGLGRGAATSTEQVTDVPPSGARWTASAPPMIEARYCMMRRPIPLCGRTIFGIPTPSSLMRSVTCPSALRRFMTMNFDLPCLTALWLVS